MLWRTARLRHGNGQFPEMDAAIMSHLYSPCILGALPDRGRASYSSRVQFKARLSAGAAPSATLN